MLRREISRRVTPLFQRDVDRSRRGTPLGAEAQGDGDDCDDMTAALDPYAIAVASVSSALNFPDQGDHEFKAAMEP